MTLLDLVGRSRRELAELARGGRPIDAGALAGWSYDGISLGLPPIARRLTWTKFGKAFCREGDRVLGWNIRMEQDALDRPWRPRRRGGAPITFGYFDVIASSLVYRPPLAMIRDPLVALDDDLLLGVSELMLGRRAIRTPTWFALRRGALPST